MPPRSTVFARLEALEARRNPKGTLEQALDAAEAILRAQSEIGAARDRGASKRELRARKRHLREVEARYKDTQWDPGIEAALDAAEEQERNPDVLRLNGYMAPGGTA